MTYLTFPDNSGSFLFSKLGIYDSKVTNIISNSKRKLFERNNMNLGTLSEMISLKTVLNLMLPNKARNKYTLKRAYFFFGRNQVFVTVCKYKFLSQNTAINARDKTTNQKINDYKHLLQKYLRL